MEEGEDFFAEFEFTKDQMRKYNLTARTEENATESGEQEDEPAEMLDPNHPLLERFQRVLKEHLTKQVARLREDVGDLETGMKNKNHEREKLGMEAYEMQQFVVKQQSDIDTSQSDLQTLSAATEELDVELKHTNDHLKASNATLFNAEKKEIELRNEVEATSSLLQQMEKWEQGVESELVVNQRIADKTRKDKIKLANEKKQQDMLIYKLMNEVWHLESELETMAMQLRVNEDEREKYAEAIMFSNIDIEASEAEHRCLIHGWQSIINTITKRDKHYNDSMLFVKKLEEKLLAITSAIKQTKKLCNKEHLKNETLTVFKDHMETMKKNANRLFNAEIEKKGKLEKCLMQYDAVLERLLYDIASVQSETSSYNTQMKTISSDYERMLIDKANLEEKIFHCLQEKSFSDKASSRLIKDAQDAKEKHREMKIRLSKLENSNSKAVKEIRFQQLENVELTRILVDLRNQISDGDMKLSKCIKDLEKCTNDQVKNLRIFQIVMRKLQKLQEASYYDLTPQEVKIRTLEGNIEDTQGRNKEMQMLWLREQTIVVDLTEKRQGQIKDLNLLKKQTTILDQKNLKINDQIEGYKNQEDVISRNINSLQNKLSAFTNVLDSKRGRKESLDGHNNFSQVELVLKLEESEFESLKLKAEITDIEEDKSALSGELVEKNREALCWEKKIKMTVEAKKNMAAEHSGEGEVGRMKSEIHRMHVRYSQLKRAQDKLIQDLEHCVARRDGIVTLAEAKVQMVKGGFQTIRVNFSKKLDDMKNKLRQIDYEEENLNQKIEMKQYEIDGIKEEMVAQEEECRKLQHMNDEIAAGIEKRKIDKQLNLDILLFKQRKLKVYSELSRGRQPFTLHKTPSAAHVVYEKEKDLNSRLRVIVENLMADFPQHNNFLVKLHNALTLPAINL